MKDSYIFIKTRKLVKEVLPYIYQIQKDHHEYDLTRQLIRSISSVYANLREAKSAESRKDYIHKLSISHKELNESIGWIELLSKINLVPNDVYLDFEKHMVEILKMLNAAIKTLKNKIYKGVRQY